MDYDLSWGIPTVEFGALGVGGAAPTVWTEMPEIVENSAKLVPTKGDRKDATVEGGDVIDVKRKRNKYSFEMEIFVMKGEERPISDNDGVVSGKYAVRLTPEDPKNEGFIMDKTVVSVEETWTGEDGKKLKYTFDGLKPATGNVLKPYTKPVE